MLLANNQPFNSDAIILWANRVVFVPAAASDLTATSGGGASPVSPSARRCAAACRLTGGDSTSWRWPITSKELTNSRGEVAAHPS